jgi:hypothetical protein
MTRSSGQFRMVAAVTALAATLAASPALQAATIEGPPRPRSMAAVETTRVAKDTTQDPGSAAPATEHKSFFKTTRGAIAIALFAGGLGYAIYSRSKDAVHSPGRK